MEINRCNDFLFKWIFGNQERKEILLSFINAVLTDGGEEDVIKDLTLIDRELDPKFYLDKSSRLDILATTVSGETVDLEIQTTNDGDIDQRSLYYWAKIYPEQLKEGMRYRDLRPVITINVLNFNYFKNDIYHNQFAILEKNQHYILNDNLRMHFIELKKWSNLSMKARNRLERWLLFLANNDPVELEEVAAVDRNITNALEAEKKFLSNTEARYVYNMREKARMDEGSRIASAEARGEVRGEAKGRMEIAFDMINEGVDMQTVSKFTRIPIEKLRQLQSNRDKQ